MHFRAAKLANIDAREEVCEPRNEDNVSLQIDYRQDLKGEKSLTVEEEEGLSLERCRTNDINYSQSHGLKYPKSSRICSRKTERRVRPEIPDVQSAFV